LPKNALIIGMPRSGTSLTASILARKGYYVGGSRLSSLQHGDDHNPFGYFEADDVVHRNVEIFRRVGFHFQNTWQLEMLPESAAAAIWELATTDADREFVACYDDRSPWLWKDQRLCFTLPYWWKLIDPAEIGVLLVRRNPRDIHRSFQRMGWCPAGSDGEKRVRQLTEQHIGTAEATLRKLNIPWIDVDYGEYVKAPSDVAARIGSFFGLELSAADLNVRPELDHSGLRGRVSARLRRLLKKLPRDRVQRLERLVPRWAIEKVFSERRYVQPPPTESAVTTTTLATSDMTGEAERVVAARLGSDPFAVAIAARRTWGRSVSVELESRLAAAMTSGAAAVDVGRREQVIRELIDELLLRLDKGSRQPV
jgi:hypothetical protein